MEFFEASVCKLIAIGLERRCRLLETAATTSWMSARLFHLPMVVLTLFILAVDKLEALERIHVMLHQC